MNGAAPATEGTDDYLMKTTASAGRKDGRTMCQPVDLPVISAKHSSGLESESTKQSFFSLPKTFRNLLIVN